MIDTTTHEAEILSIHKQDIAILFRNLNDDSTEEISAIQEHFILSFCLGSPFLKKKLVIGRFSVLPFYREVEASLAYQSSMLVNTYRQHRFAADISNWYPVLQEFTPRTWFDLPSLPDKNVSFVAKGETNSKKFLWDTHMFAKDKDAAIRVYLRLQEDSMISQQKIVFREYVPLRKLDEGLHGLPITEEYRFFVFQGEVVSGGFYWSSHSELLEKHPELTPSCVPASFLSKVVSLISPHIPFFVLDVARTETGEWIVVELNDAQMSGLSENKPEVLWGNIAKKFFSL